MTTTANNLCAWCGGEIIGKRPDAVYCQNTCKSQKQYYNDPEKSRQDRRRSYLKHREKRCLTARLKRLEINQGSTERDHTRRDEALRKKRLLQQRYYQQNKASIKAVNHRYREKNKAKLAEKARQKYRLKQREAEAPEKNPGSIRAIAKSVKRSNAQAHLLWQPPRMVA